VLLVTALAAALVLGLLADQVRLALQLAAAVTGQHRSTFGAHPQDLSPAYDDVTFPSRVDHLALRGWLLHAALPSRRSVVFLHGSNADRAINADNARAMVQAGYDVLLFDFRGCGRSDGEHQTLGSLEPRDVLGAHDYMVGRGYAASRMTFLGISDGATALLRGAPGMPDVAAIVSDSAYDRLAPTLDAFWSGAGVPARLRWLAPGSRASTVSTPSPPRRTRSVPHPRGRCSSFMPVAMLPSPPPTRSLCAPHRRAQRANSGSPTAGCTWRPTAPTRRSTCAGCMRSSTRGSHRPPRDIRRSPAAARPRGGPHGEGLPSEVRIRQGGTA
jgi:pimeloyl-ACP methyl ester carboxylesterase